jgi:SAM-dependent methyltransferase
MQLGAARGVGFDIAENLVAQAQETAEKAVIPCEFVCTDILQISPDYASAFDMVFFTIGAITWFQDLNALFSIAARCLKPGGVLYLHDFHPVVNMLPMPGEDAFDGQPKLAHSYFKQDPWIENNGMGYMTTEYQSKTFTSFSHTVGSILNALINTGFTIRMFNEFDYDVGMTDAYDGKGFPLSMLLKAEKRA